MLALISSISVVLCLLQAFYHRRMFSGRLSPPGLGFLSPAVVAVLSACMKIEWITYMRRVVAVLLYTELVQLRTHLFDTAVGLLTRELF